MSQIKFSKIETKRLELRKFKETDAEVFFQYRTNPKVALYQSELWVDFTIEQAVEFVREQSDFELGIPDSWFQIAIELKDTRSLVGDLAIHTLPQDVNQVEIGFTLGPEYQNKGFGIEAVRSLLGFIFDAWNRHRVIAITDVRNKRSVKLLEKIGMRKEGHFIKNAWNKGEYTDEYLFALLKEEWK
ncbi:GNAT family protein [Desulfosporosinus sp. FKA]|uniref:GNAT family N-acetyltransferase n=1 Tax=Desulfosporosinus sp. FKA TaxID=1969834 RepID=UPI000B4A4CBA|nr:GNAT family protein [Desulfosporosinus sp. FKA]